jgi:L-asparagine oxygenase
MLPRGARIINIDSNGDISKLLGETPTPSSLDDLSTEKYQSDDIKRIDSLLRINAMRWGTVYGFANEQMGRTVQNIFPVKSDSSEQISSSSSVELELHTETAFHAEKPDTVFLYCLRDDQHAGTTVSQLDDFIGDIDRETRNILKKASFITTIDKSFAKANNASLELKTSILSDDEKSISYDKALMRGATEEAQAALNVLLAAVERHKKTIVLKAGEALVMHNHSTIHGRTSFTARYDGTDRWLKRIMIKLGGPSREVSFLGDESFWVVKTLY